MGSFVPASDQVDFLVVGAGPVGLLTAILLGQDGWRVTVVERWPSRYPMPRACTIDHEALRILQSAGIMANHADLFEPSRGERGGYQIRNGDGVLLRAINWNRAAESGWANTNGFYQPDLEEVLESTARQLDTVEILRGWAVTGLVQDADSVTIRTTKTGRDARTEQLSARWLIGADGANSAVRELVGIDSVDAGFEADWLVVDYEPIVDREWDAFVTQYCDPRQPATAVNSGPGRRRFEFMRREDVTAEQLGSSESAWKLMQPWQVTPENARLERHAVYTFRGRWADQWRNGRVFLAGDAAHLMPPFMGQGMCSGLRDARSLAWRLSMVAAGLADAKVLDSYATERLAHVRVIIDEAIALGQIICEQDPVRAAERDATMGAQAADPAALTVEPPHPRLGSPSITASADPSAGTLSLQARVEAGGRTGLFDDVVSGGWQLIGFEVDPLAEVPDELRSWFDGLGATTTTVSTDGEVRDIDGAYRAWFAEHRCGVVLVRPDFYIYGTGGPRDVERLLRSLRDELAGIPGHHRATAEKEGALS
jgi:2-polyprenyl-6-methoxyphenol hydroxylase-like FAD-dependent oxidoreductase